MVNICTSTAGGTGSIPGQGTKIPQVMLHSQKKHKTTTTTTTKNDSSRNNRASGEITIDLELYPVPELSKLTSHIQRTGAQGSQARRRNKNYPYWKERVKLSVLIILFIEYPRDPHNEY